MSKPNDKATWDEWLACVGVTVMAILLGAWIWMSVNSIGNNRSDKEESVVEEASTE